MGLKWGFGDRQGALCMGRYMGGVGVCGWKLHGCTTWIGEVDLTPTSTQQDYMILLLYSVGFQGVVQLGGPVLSV